MAITTSNTGLIKDFGRRTFLKGAAVTLGVASMTMAGCAPKQELEESNGDQAASEEQVYVGSCRGNCFGGCILDVTVRDGKVVSTTAKDLPDARYNRICQRGHSHLQRIYDPLRLQTPVRRVGERGSGEWEQITWDEAIEEISTKWEKYQDEFGPESIMFMAGSGNFGVSTNHYTQRLKTAMGASTVSFCYDNAYFYGTGQAEGVGEGFCANEVADLLNAKTIILWGTNPSEAQPQNWHFIMEAKAAGAKLVCIDPTYTVAASRSDIYVPIRPATDNALVMAMINYVVENNWIDADYIKKATVGPLLVKKENGKYLRNSDFGVKPTTTTNPTTGAEVTVDPLVVRGVDGTVGTVDVITDPVYEGSYEVEGIAVTCAYTLFIEKCKEWTLERASEVCDIPIETIQEITRIYAQEGPSSIYQGFGPDHYVNGHKFYATSCALAGITGNMSKEGASCGYEWAYAGYLNIVKPALLLPATELKSRMLPSPQLPEIVKNKTLEGEAIDLKSIYIWVSNPVSNQTDRLAWVEMLNNLEFVVVADMTIGDTAMYADIVLPVAHWFEYNEIMAMTSPYLVYSQKAIDPLHESKTDLEIVNLLADAMGHSDDFGYTMEEYLEATMTNPSAEAFGVTWDQLLDEKLIRAYSASPYIHAKDGVYPTPTTRLQFYLETPAPHVNFGQQINTEKERLPYWEPPKEAWPTTVGGFEANALGAQYPLIFTTERNKMKCHTQWGHSSWLVEIYPEPTIKLHPQDAEARSIAEGDYVRVFNDRGDAVFRAHHNPGVRPGVLVAPKGWELDQFKQGHYSNLTSRAMDPACPNNCFFDNLVELEKVQV